jgi:soluble lytic murein transglycosylase-like protein
MRTTPSALVALTLLSLCSMPYGQDAAGDTAQVLSKAAQGTAEASEEAASKADYVLKDTATDVAVATKNAAHRTAEAGAGAKTAHVSTDARQLREKSERWVDYYAHAYGVPVELVEAIIDQESGWNPRAVSRKGAVGLMQLMPETATRFGVRNRFRIDENIRGGVAYLAWLSQRCNGDVRLMTAAYYGGEYQISSRRLAHSSPEVRAYVKQIAQRYRERRMQVRTMPPRERNKSRVVDTNASSRAASDQWATMYAQAGCAVSNITDVECFVSQYSAARLSR